MLQMFVNWFCLEVLRDKLFRCRNLENWAVFLESFSILMLMEKKSPSSSE